MLFVASGAGAEAPAMVLGSAYPLGHEATTVGLRFGDKLAELTAGKVKVAVRHSGALGLERELAQRVQLGTLDFAAVTVPVLAGFAPEVSILELPYLFREYQHVFTSIDASDVLRKHCERALETKGFKLVALIVVGYRSLWGSVPINGPDDMRAKRVRVADDRRTLATFEALGAKPVVIPFPEIPAAFRAQSIDLAEGPPATFVRAKLYETIKNVTDVRHVHQMGALVVAKATWAHQDATVHKAIQDAAKYAERENRQAILVEDDAFKREILAKGLTVTRPDPVRFRETVRRVYDEFYASAAGRDARATVEVVVGLK